VFISKIYLKMVYSFVKMWTIMQSALSAVRNKTCSHSLSPASYSSSEIQSSADAGAQNKSTDLQDILFCSTFMQLLRQTWNEHLMIYINSVVHIYFLGIVQSDKQVTLIMFRSSKAAAYTLFKTGQLKVKANDPLS